MVFYYLMIINTKSQIDTMENTMNTYNSTHNQHQNHNNVEAYVKWIMENQYDFFLTFTPANPNTTLKQLTNDTNQVLNSLNNTLKRDDAFIEGFSFVENSKLRANGKGMNWVPHIHIIIRNLPNLSLNRFQNLIFNRACSIKNGKSRAFNPNYIDVQQVRDSSTKQLVDYLTKSAKFKLNSNATDFINPLVKAQIKYDGDLH